MKKSIIKIVLGFLLWVFSAIVLNIHFDDMDIAGSRASMIAFGYFILLSLIAYIKNLWVFNKNGRFPHNSKLAILVVEGLAITTDKSIDVPISMMESSYNSSKDFTKKNYRLGKIVYTLFYITIWSILLLLLYHFRFMSTGLTLLSNILLSVAFISFMLAILIIWIFVISTSIKDKKSTNDKKIETEIDIPLLSFELKSFKRHYAKWYYVLARLAFVFIFLLVGFGIYIIKFDGTVGDIHPIFYFIIGCCLLFAIIYASFVFPMVIHELKKNQKKQTIQFDPLKIYMVLKDGDDGYGNYLKAEKVYVVNKIYSYKMTNRYFIINGDIESVTILSSDDESRETRVEKTKLKIPRSFSDEYIFINYLNENIVRSNN